MLISLTGQCPRFSDPPGGMKKMENKYFNKFIIFSVKKQNFHSNNTITKLLGPKVVLLINVKLENNIVF